MYIVQECVQRKLLQVIQYSVGMNEQLIKLWMLRVDYESTGKKAKAHRKYVILSETISTTDGTTV